MIIRTTARFPDTEAAQAAARRIADTTAEIYELRLYYDTAQDDTGVSNNILYSSMDSYLPKTPVKSVSREFFTDDVAGELRHECLISVMTDEKNADNVRRIIYNEGGCDVSATEAY